MSIDSWLKKKGENYRDWKEKAPERRAEKLDRLKDQLEIQKVKQSIAESRMDVSKQRISVLKERQKTMPKGAGGMGMFGMPKIDEPKQPIKTRKRKRKRKGKRK